MILPQYFQSASLRMSLLMPQRQRQSPAPSSRATGIRACLPGNRWSQMTRSSGSHRPPPRRLLRTSKASTTGETMESLWEKALPKAMPRKARLVILSTPVDHPFQRRLSTMRLATLSFYQMKTRNPLHSRLWGRTLLQIQMQAKVMITQIILKEALQSISLTSMLRFKLLHSLQLSMLPAVPVQLARKRMTPRYHLTMTSCPRKTKKSSTSVNTSATISRDAECCRKD